MIVAHHDDYKIFQEVLSGAVSELQSDAHSRPDYYITRGGVRLEKDVYEFINKHAENTVFSGNVELVSGQRFPDIVAYVNQNKAYGVEVKTTQSNSWKSTGSSIFEGTRVDDVKKIHLLFGKLSAPINFRCRKYEECLYDVAITHSPRYLIDMETQTDQSIFSKVGLSYDELRQLENPFKPIRAYLRRDMKAGEDLWWIDSSSKNVRDLKIKLWGNLEGEQKERLRVLALAYFPNLLGSDPQKYAPLATWLVSRFSIVNHALRDTFTAGGKVVIQEVECPKIIDRLLGNLDKIIKVVHSMEEDDMSFYWQVDFPIKDPVFVWKQKCLEWCKTTLNPNQVRIVEEKFSLIQ